MNSTPQANQPHGERLLLSSIADFWSLLEPLLDAAAPKTVCEIGVGKGEFTTVLLDFCRRNNCRYCGIDPAADAAMIRQFKTAQADFFQSPSLSVLPDLPAQDIYFVDGDHNYYTVLNELRLILQKENHRPLVILHDVGWPWGRRDHYCAPETIPQAFLHPHSTRLGAVPGSVELKPGGFSGETSAYKYGAAEHEGGPRNGVLTAVEDFLREPSRAEWKLLLVPAVFGLGILYAPEKCPPEAASQLRCIEASVASLGNFLSLLERNRVDLFLTYLRQISEFNALQAEYKKLDQHANSLKDKYRELNDHSDALLAAYRSLEAHARAVEEARDALLRKTG